MGGVRKWQFFADLQYYSCRRRWVGGRKKHADVLLEWSLIRPTLFFGICEHQNQVKNLYVLNQMDRAILAYVDLEQKHICKLEPQKLQR